MTKLDEMTADAETSGEVHRDDATYHSSRAMEELNHGLAASCLLTAKAHLKLASMHLAKARELGATGDKPLLMM